MKQYNSSFISTLLFIALTAGACNTGNKTDNTDEKEPKELQVDQSETQKLFSETMTVHDLAMEEMGEIFNLRKMLVSKIDSIQNSNDTTGIIHLRSLVVDLENADEGMMSWMAQFETKYRNENTDKSITYYKDQKKSVDIVWENIEISIKAAKEELGN